MGLILGIPQPAAPVMPPARLTSYRYWESYAPQFLRAIRDTLARVVDDIERQGDLFGEDAAAPAEPARNETLGNLLSPSQANAFLNCSARWWFKYGAGLPDPAGSSLVRGRAVHKAIEHYHRERLAGSTPELADLAECYDIAWDAAAAGAQFAATDDIDALKRSGARLLRLYLDEVAPHVEAARVEQKVEGEIAGVRVQGFVDLVDVNGRVCDVKTAAKSPAGLGSDYAFQLATYESLLPGASGQARVDYLVDTKTPKLVTIEYAVSDADRQATVSLYPRVREGIREGLYFPNRHGNLCSRKYCNFADACEKEFGGRVE